MSDKVWVGFSVLGDLSTAGYWGVVKYENGKFSLDKKRLYNRLRRAANAGANVVRVLPLSCWEVKSREAMFQPFAWDTVQGAWDVSRYNDYYFPIVKEFVEVARTVGMKVLFELFDNCGLWPSIRWLNPWTWNANGIENFYVEADPIYKWVNKVIGELGNSVLYGMGNELTDAVGLIRTNGLLTGTKMFSKILPILKISGITPFSYGADLDIPTESTHSSVMKAMAMDVEQIWDENAKVQLFRPCHQACSATSDRVITPVAWWRYHSILFSDDGAFPRPTASEWAVAMKYVLDRQSIDVAQFGQAGKARLMFEHCPESDDWEAEAGMINSMTDIAGLYWATFENKGRFPNDWVDPQPEPEPEPDPEPQPEPEPGFNLWGWIKNRLPWIVLLIVLVIIAILVV